MNDDTVSQFIADKRLNIVRQIGDQNLVRLHAEAHRIVINVNRFYYDPVLIDVQMAFAAFTGDLTGFRAGVMSLDITAESVGQFLSYFICQ